MMEGERLDTTESAFFENFVYVLKAALAALFGILLMRVCGLPLLANWAAISAVVVTQPALHPSLVASLHRVWGNLVGGFLGALINGGLGHSLPVATVGLLMTGLLCFKLRLNDAVRPALIAFIITVFDPLSHHAAFGGALERLVAVCIGCASALGVALVFHFLPGPGDAAPLKGK